MKSLVTGCLGFIGSHLVKRLLEQWYDVIDIDVLPIITQRVVNSCS